MAEGGIDSTGAQEERQVQGGDGSLETPVNYPEVLEGFRRRILLMRHQSAAPTAEQTDYLLAIAGFRDKSRDDEYRKELFPDWASGWSREHFVRLDQELREAISADQTIPTQDL